LEGASKPAPRLKSMPFQKYFNKVATPRCPSEIFRISPKKRDVFLKETSHLTTLNLREAVSFQEEFSGGKLTYPTWGKGKSSSNMPFLGDMLVPWRVF